LAVKRCEKRCEISEKTTPSQRKSRRKRKISRSFLLESRDDARKKQRDVKILSHLAVKVVSSSKIDEMAEEAKRE